MKRKLSLLTGALAVALAGFGCGGETPAPQASTPAPVVPAPAKVPAKPAEPDHLEILSVLSVEQEVDILAQRSGTLVELLQEEGNRVAKGAGLARLDDRDLVAQVDRARADLGVAESNVKFNEAELRARQAAYRRAQEMRKQGLNSDADLEEAEFRAKGAQYDLEGWKQVVERNKASLRMLELDLEKTRIRAPFDGIVVRRYIRLGQDVLKDDRCFRLGQLAPLLVKFLVPETAARRPRKGDTVDFILLSDTRTRHTARIEKVSPTVDPGSGSYDVTAVLSGAATGDLRPGMAVRVLWPGAKP